MLIRGRKNESFAGLIKRAKENLTKRLRTLSTSTDEAYSMFREKSPAFAKAVQDYTLVHKKLQKVEDEGLLEEFKEVSKNLIKAFRFKDNAADRDFMWANYQYDDVSASPLYVGMEAIFDASLFRESGAMRNFEKVYNLSRTIRKVGMCEFIFYYKPYFYYVNASSGMVLRLKRKVEDFDFEKYEAFEETIKYDGQIIYDTYAGGLMWTFKDPSAPKQSGTYGSGTTYRKIELSKKDKSVPDDKDFSLCVHQIIVLCWYGLNVYKFCMGSGSILTIDHHNGDSLDSRIDNLAILTRSDNAAKGQNGSKGINFIPFFERCGYCTSPFGYDL